ncbi:MAG: shikimate dehydrogenase, partial [Candidatus Nanopelagicaceae bacterium]
MRKRAAVLGSPIAHSLSPAIHNAAYLALGMEGKYDSVEVKAGELAPFMEQVRNTAANWIGFSLTMPLKEEIFQVADRIDPLAMQIRSGNTLLPTTDGWLATTTDVAGFMWALSSNQVDNFETITIIGAGATARAAALAVDAPGRVITIINRNPDREELLHQIVTQGELKFSGWSEVNLGTDLVINTTPKG